MRILFAIIAVLILFVIVPHVKRGEFISPNPLPPNTWITRYDQTGYADALAQPPEGYGWSRFDFWNKPPDTRRRSTSQDFQLRY